ncbi:hypothetical protein LXL04_030483 [Taraxacum kok-saghyz]
MDSDRRTARSPEATKGEIQKLFGKFGRLTDVFMGLKIGKNGKHFVFIRFAGVKDDVELERKLNGTTLRGKKLEINISIHERKKNPRVHTSVNRRMPSTTTRWLTKTSLIGEARSLDHLGHLPKLLTLKDDACMEIKYLGGLRVLLLFDDSLYAKKFKANEERWKEHLKWVSWGDQTLQKFDRVAWIRIVGLPLHMWGTVNFEAITKELGKIIAPFDTLPARVALSCAKIGILTERKTRINEEVRVVFGGKSMNIGITEFDEDWWPFRFDPSKDFYEDESESGEEEDDGISDTWMDAEDEEREKGEIRDEEEQTPAPMTVEELVCDPAARVEPEPEHTQSETSPVSESETHPPQTAPENEQVEKPPREKPETRGMQAIPPRKEGDSTPRDTNSTPRDTDHT